MKNRDKKKLDTREKLFKTWTNIILQKKFFFQFYIFKSQVKQFSCVVKFKLHIIFIFLNY